MKGHLRLFLAHRGLTEVVAFSDFLTIFWKFVSL